MVPLYMNEFYAIYIKQNLLKMWSFIIGQHTLVCFGQRTLPHYQDYGV